MTLNNKEQNDNVREHSLYIMCHHKKCHKLHKVLDFTIRHPEGISVWYANKTGDAWIELVFAKGHNNR